MFKAHDWARGLRIDNVQDAKHALVFRLFERVSLPLEARVDIIEVGGSAPNLFEVFHVEADVGTSAVEVVVVQNWADFEVKGLVGAEGDMEGCRVFCLGCCYLKCGLVESGDAGQIVFGLDVQFYSFYTIDGGGDLAASLLAAWVGQSNIKNEGVAVRAMEDVGVGVEVFLDLTKRVFAFHG